MPHLDRLYFTPRHFRPGSFNAYLLAAALVAVATSLRVMLGDTLPGLQFVFFFPAVIATTVFCGFAAGAFSVILGAVCAWYFILPPAFSFALKGVQEIYVLIFFVVVAGSIVICIGGMRTAMDRVRRLNANLNTANQTLTAVFQSNPDAVLIADRQGCITSANQRATDLFGKPGTDLIGAAIESLMPDRYRARHPVLLRGYMANPRPREMGLGLELFALKADGAEFPVDIQIGPIEIEGEVRGIATIRDLTNQRTLQRELMESRQQQAVLREREAGNRALESALESTTDSVAVLDHAWRFTYLNQHATAKFGDGRELRGQTIWEVFPDLAETSLGNAFRSAMESGLPVHADAFVPHFQSHFEAHAYPSTDGLTLFLHDVTGERRAVAALTERETQLRLFIDRAPAAIAMFDKEMRYLAASRRYALDYQIHEDVARALIGQSHYALFPDMPAHWLPIHRRVMAGETLSADEEPFRREDGRTDWLRWEMTPWHRADGAIGGAVLFSEIITERKENEQALRDMTEDLSARLRENETLLARLREEVDAREAAQARAANAERVQALGELAGGMAHDFNNLLGVIILNLGLAQRFIPDSDRAKKLVVDSLASARSGAELIRRLLAFARRQALRPARVALNELLSGMHGLLMRVLRDDIEIVLDLAPNLWPVVADPAQLEACIINLATNARDAMPKGGKLTIATGNQPLDTLYASLNPSVTPGDYAMIAVSDTGIGMTPEVLARVFEPFFTTKEVGHGTGLGLSMVFGFAQQSGGHVSIYSEPGVGTTIRLFLPRAIDTDASGIPADAADPTASEAGRGETVLVVEDNAAMRQAVVHQLALLRYRVLEADQAAAALAMLETEVVDLVFSDVVMPGGVDGFELATQIRARWPSVKVLLTSGFSSNPIAERAGNARSAPRVLVKPFDIEQLSQALREILEV